MAIAHRGGRLVGVAGRIVTSTQPLRSRGNPAIAAITRAARQTAGAIQHSTRDASLLRGDVLLALRTTEDELFPAPSAIERPEHVVRTSDLDRVVGELRDGAAIKLVVTAVGGVGKSVLTTVLAQALPEGLRAGGLRLLRWRGVPEGHLPAP
jgi:Mrp family chromosome partitioning ATPase